MTSLWKRALLCVPLVLLLLMQSQATEELPSYALQRRGVGSGSGGLGGRIKDTLHVGSKAGTSARALEKVKDSGSHTTVKTLKRLNTKDLSKVGPEHVADLSPKSVIKLNDHLASKVAEKKGAIDKGLNQMSNPTYTRAFNARKPEADLHKAIQDQHGHGAGRGAERPVTKTLVHEDLKNTRKGMDSLRGTINAVGHRLTKIDAGRHEEVKKPVSTKTLLNAHDKQVNMFQAHDPNGHRAALKDQANRYATTRESAVLDPAKKSAFAEHPNHPDANGRSTSSRTKYTFEGKEGKYQRAGKLSPLYVYGSAHKTVPDPPSTHGALSTTRTPQLNHGSTSGSSRAAPSSSSRAPGSGRTSASSPAATFDRSRSASSVSSSDSSRGNSPRRSTRRSLGDYLKEPAR